MTQRARINDALVMACHHMCLAAWAVHCSLEENVDTDTLSTLESEILSLQQHCQRLQWSWEMREATPTVAR